VNATNKAGEVWTGETEVEGSYKWFHYTDAAGREYQSKEQPAYRINMNTATMTPHGIAPIDPTITRPWRGVFVDGPHPTTDRDGDEIPEWTVCVGNEDAEPQGTVYFCQSHGSARALAARMSKDRRLEIVDESMAA
jgi:hypothetical protein